MRPIQGTPFSGGSPFASSPGMSAMGKGFGSSSMAGGMGGFNMPPFAAMGMMGKSSPFSGGSSPFGGGGKALSDGIKKLVDSNKDLIAAIKDLTKSIRSLEKGMGGQGPGGMGAGPGRIGLGGGMDALNARMLQRLQQGMGDRRPQSAQSANQERMQQAMDTGDPMQVLNAGQYNQNQGAIVQGMRGGFGRRAATGLYNFGRGLFGRGAVGNIPMSGNRATTIAEQAGNMVTGTPGNAALGQAGAAAAAQATAGNRFQSALGSGAARSMNVLANMGSGTNAAEIVSQIPYIGGLLAAPLQVLEGRKQAAMAVEMPSMVYTGASRGTTQAGNPMAANGSLINAGASMLGMSATETLNAATQIVQSGGMRTQVSGNDLSSAIASGLGFGTYGAAASGGIRGSGVRGLAGFDATSLRQQMFAAGLTGQGAAKYLNSMLSVGEQFTGIGINLGGGTISEIGGLMNSGMRSFEGDAAAGAYTRMRLKGGVAVGQQLGGTFSGLGQNVLMADALQRTGGDFFAARRQLERMEPSEMKSRLRGMLGGEVGDMAMMGMGFTTDEIEAIRKGKPAEAALPTGANAGAIITKADAESSARKLKDTYDNQLTNIKELIRINEKIEKKLLDGLDVKDMETLLDTISDSTSVIRAAAQAIVDGIGKVIDFFKNPPWPFSDERLKEDIKHIGYSPSGLKIYSWKYKHNPCGTFSGVMAQDILNIIPEAISKDERGYYMVDYRLLDVDMQNISMEVA